MVQKSKIRDVLKNKTEDSYRENCGDAEIEPGPRWDTGRDVPLTWDPTELKRLRKQTLRDNLKNRVITKEQFLAMLKRRQNAQPF
jgi:hypothetical protein